MGQCAGQIFTELWEDESYDSDDSADWKNCGINKKTVHSKGVLRSTRGHGYSCTEFKESDDVKSRRQMYRFGNRNVSVVAPTEIPQIAEEVQGELALTYAHGYNGRFLTSRQNLYLSHDNDKLIYFIAGVCVSYDYNKNKQTFFKEHNDDITTICIAPKSLNKPWCASGQKDPKERGGKIGKDMPKVWIWNYKTMERVQLIDNVCWGKIEKVQWSANSNYLYILCGNDDHTLKVYDAKDFDAENPLSAIKPILSQDLYKGKIYGFEINPKPIGNDVIDEIVVFGKSNFKHIVVRNGPMTLEKQTVSVRKFNGKGEKSYGCVAFLSNGYYAIGAQSGNVYLCKGNAAKKLLTGIHTKSVGDLCWDKKEKTLISAAFDNKIIHWSFNGKALKKESKIEMNKDTELQPRCMTINAATKQIFVGTKNNQILQINQGQNTSKCILDGHDGEVWGLCTNPRQSEMYATGSYDKCIKIWSSKTKKCVHTEALPMIQSSKKRKKNKNKNCIRCAAWSEDGQFLAFGTEDSYIYFYTFNTMEQNIKLHEVIHIPRRSRRAPIEAVSHLRFSPDSKILACTHMNSRLYLFDIFEEGNNYDLKQWKATMEHIAAPIQCQFSHNGEHEVIKTFTRDYEIVHWILNRTNRDCKFCPWIPDPNELKFYGDPLIAGYDVKGCQCKGFDGTDLNQIAVTKDKKLCISGDDFASIRLYNYPAIKQKPFKKYTNHAEFVVGVKLLANDSDLITVGGADRAVFQWKLTKLYEHNEEDIEEQYEEPLIASPKAVKLKSPNSEEYEAKSQSNIPKSIHSQSNKQNSSDIMAFGQAWFESIGMDEYYKIFINEGYEDWEVVNTLTEDDLEQMGITKGGHRKKLLIKIQQQTSK